MPTPPKDKDDLWAAFQEKSGANRYLVSGKTLATVVAVALIVLAAFALG